MTIIEKKFLETILLSINYYYLIGILETIQLCANFVLDRFGLVWFGLVL